MPDEIIIKPNGYYLIKEAQGKNGTTDLPAPDISGNISMSATDGKVALVKNNQKISGIADENVVDFVGYGKKEKVNEYEGTGPAPAPSNTTSIARKNACIDTNDNTADFETGNPSPQSGPMEEPEPAPEPTPPPPPDPAPPTYSSEIIINEIFPAPKKDNPIREFVEFYNSSDADINLKGWKLKDDALQKKTGENCILSDDLTVETGNYKYFYLSSCKSNSIALNNSGDSLTLYNPTDPLPVSSVEYKNAKSDLSYGLDGATWRWSKFLTPGEKNIFNNLPTVSSKKTNEIYVNIYADFSAEGSDADNDTLKYTWDFGDGHKSYKAKTRHKYEAIGKYTATLKVSDDSEDVITTYDIEVIEFPKLKIKITALSSNPSGKDTGSEYITLKNETKKKINLKDWSIAAGWKKLINHPIREDFKIKAGKSKDLTNEFASIALNNTKSKIELRDPSGRVIDKVKYEKKDGIPDDTVYEKIKKKWQWNEKPASPATEEIEDVEPEAILPEVLEDTEDINIESDISDEEIHANLGKSSINPAWQKKKENKILLASADSHLKISLPEPQGQAFGASTIRATENYYFFTYPTAPEKHWAVKIFDKFITTANSSINKLLFFN